MSIYKVLKGNVRISKKLDDHKFTLATLERGIIRMCSEFHLILPGFVYDKLHYDTR